MARVKTTSKKSTSRSLPARTTLVKYGPKRRIIPILVPPTVEQLESDARREYGRNHNKYKPGGTDFKAYTRAKERFQRDQLRQLNHRPNTALSELRRSVNSTPQGGLHVRFKRHRQENKPKRVSHNAITPSQRTRLQNYLQKVLLANRSARFLDKKHVHTPHEGSQKKFYHSPHIYLGPDPMINSVQSPRAVSKRRKAEFNRLRNELRARARAKPRHTVEHKTVNGKTHTHTLMNMPPFVPRHERSRGSNNSNGNNWYNNRHVEYINNSNNEQL
jgi:hypothetical protein